MSKWIVVSRKWNNPNITIEITDSGINVRMSIDDFEAALKQEIGSVATTFTKAAIEAKIATAISNVIEGMKKETERVAVSVPVDLVK